MQSLFIIEARCLKISTIGWEGKEELKIGFSDNIRSFISDQAVEN